jgi:CHAD domain-containing protein
MSANGRTKNAAPVTARVAPVKAVAPMAPLKSAHGATPAHGTPHVTNGSSITSTSGMAGTFLVAKLCGFDVQLGEAVPRVLGTGDEEAVHDFRVAMRRTRTLLEVGRPVFGRFHANEVRLALRDVHRATGALRDEEVLIELVASLGVDRPDVGAWLDGRRRRERRLRTALRRKIREGELDRGRRLLEAMVAFRIKPSRDRRVTKFARKAVGDASRAVDRRRGAALHDGEALHELRIAYKRLRYTIETFAAVLPTDAAALAQSATRLQNKLGKVHDVDMAIGVVRTARSLPDAGREALMAALLKLRGERVAALADSLGAPIPAATEAAGT